jgi:hypothetical protein
MLRQSGPTPTRKTQSPKIRRLSEFSENLIMDRPRLRSFQKSYAAVSTGVSSQRHSLRELARFLRSSERRTVALSQSNSRTRATIYPAMQIRPGIRILNKEQK